MLALRGALQVERKRVAVNEDRSLFGDTARRGRYPALNKLNDRNFVVVSHSIFRILVDDSKVSAEAVFDQITRYAFRYHRNSRLLAPVCGDLARFYPALPSTSARASRPRSEPAHTTRAGADGGYGAYLDDLERRRAACGCFLFVSNLTLHGASDPGSSSSRSRPCSPPSAIRRAVATDQTSAARGLPTASGPSSGRRGSARRVRRGGLGPPRCATYGPSWRTSPRGARGPVLHRKSWFGLVELAQQVG